MVLFMLLCSLLDQVLANLLNYGGRMNTSVIIVVITAYLYVVETVVEMEGRKLLTSVA
jgi:hypothetical protein